MVTRRRSRALAAAAYHTSAEDEGPPPTRRCTRSMAANQAPDASVIGDACGQMRRERRQRCGYNVLLRSDERATAVPEHATASAEALDTSRQLRGVSAPHRPSPVTHAEQELHVPAMIDDADLRADSPPPEPHPKRRSGRRMGLTLTDAVACSPSQQREPSEQHIHAASEISEAADDIEEISKQLPQARTRAFKRQRAHPALQELRRSTRQRRLPQRYREVTDLPDECQTIAAAGCASILSPNERSGLPFDRGRT